MDFNGHHEPIIRRLKNELGICGIASLSTSWPPLFFDHPKEEF